MNLGHLLAIGGSAFFSYLFSDDHRRSHKLHCLVPNSAPMETLRYRVCFGGRKGRRAERRIRQLDRFNAYVSSKQVQPKGWHFTGRLGDILAEGFSSFILVRAAYAPWRSTAIGLFMGLRPDFGWIVLRQDKLAGLVREVMSQKIRVFLRTETSCHQHEKLSESSSM